MYLSRQMLQSGVFWPHILLVIVSVWFSVIIKKQPSVQLVVCSPVFGASVLVRSVSLGPKVGDCLAHVQNATYNLLHNLRLPLDPVGVLLNSHPQTFHQSVPFQGGC